MRIVQKKCFKAPDIGISYDTSVLYFDGVKPVVPVEYKIDFASPLRTPVIELHVRTAVIDPSPQMLQNKSL